MSAKIPATPHIPSPIFSNFPATPSMHLRTLNKYKLLPQNTHVKKKREENFEFSVSNRQKEDTEKIHMYVKVKGQKGRQAGCWKVSTKRKSTTNFWDIFGKKISGIRRCNVPRILAGNLWILDEVSVALRKGARDIITTAKRKRGCERRETKGRIRMEVVQGK